MSSSSPEVIDVTSDLSSSCDSSSNASLSDSSSSPTLSSQSPGAPSAVILNYPYVPNQHESKLLSLANSLLELDTLDPRRFTYFSHYYYLNFFLTSKTWLSDYVLEFLADTFHINRHTFVKKIYKDFEDTYAETYEEFKQECLSNMLNFYNESPLEEPFLWMENCF
ncbi:hypothetical protein GEMRC1_006387 [Eukaryota sp. GEM-RC1]